MVHGCPTLNEGLAFSIMTGLGERVTPQGAAARRISPSEAGAIARPWVMSAALGCNVRRASTLASIADLATVEGCPEVRPPDDKNPHLVAR